MNEFKVRRVSDRHWTILNRTGHYLHADGQSYYLHREYWPTREQAQAVLDKFNSKGTKLKKGDRVKIRDFSYAVCVSGHALKEYGYYAHDAKGEFVVIETGCKFPAVHPDQDKHKRYNDTVIRSVQSGRVVCIEERFLNPVSHTIIIIDGKEVAISREFYQELKRSLQWV